ncbi:MAG: CDP-diacylglycerol--serine O-phosphatidyltransferase [Firmicutes bacterium]|nr:CDP-diacylglycerol--serine O-phosphatidyltransferase [Bacillota bacterium]
MNNGDWKKLIPNLMTMANMTLGLGTVLLLLRPGTGVQRLVCVVLILAGGLIDALDGSIARRLQAATEMGKQLDSFADLITFGVAPIALLHAVGFAEYSPAVTILGWVYLIAGAYRLARYNLGDFTDHFIGLPITAAGIILALYCAIFLLWEGLNPKVTTPLVLAGLSLLMVSRFKINRL